MLLKINELINKNIKESSGYRKGKVFIKGADFVPPNSELVPNKMNELLYQFQNNDLSLIENIANFHIVFERIHPFEDGNGRTGRVLINHLLISNNEMPIVIPDDRRIEYFEYLQNYDVEGFTKFIIELQNNEKNKMIEYGIEIN